MHSFIHKLDKHFSFPIDDGKVVRPWHFMMSKCVRYFKFFIDLGKLFNLKHLSKIIFFKFTKGRLDNSYVLIDDRSRVSRSSSFPRWLGKFFIP